LRIKALEIFHRSETYHRLTSNNPDFSISELEMEQEIAQFMSLMEPSHLDQNAEVGGEIQRFLFLAGYLIALADGAVDDAEVQTLGRIVNREVFAQCLKSVVSANEGDIREEITKLVQSLSTYLSPMQKLNMIRDLCLIASANGEIHDSERNVLYDLCYMQNIRPDFADQVLYDSCKELD